ncbi:Tetratricopeptide repeat protein [Zobellia nedashkovskayae]
MAILEQEKQSKIDKLRFEADQYFLNEKEKYYCLKEKAWNLYPEPKNTWNEAYSLAKDIFESYLYEENYIKAKEWLNLMIDTNNVLHLMDEDCPFNIAKFKFDTKEYDDALHTFQEVVKVAGMRYFENEDPKYRNFYLNPEKFMNK